MSDRANTWERLFATGNAMKDYRVELYRDIERLEEQVEKYRSVLTDLGIPDPYPPDIPF